MLKITDFNDFDYQAQGNLFYSRNWLDILLEEYEFDFKIVTDDIQPDNPLLIFAKINDIFGKRIISLPFCDYTEPLVESESELFSVLAFLEEKYPAYSATLKYHGAINDTKLKGYKNIRQAVCHRIPLTDNIDDIWNRTSRAFRKGTNKAERNGLRVQSYNLEEGIDIFHRMLTELRRNKFHILPQPKSFYLLFFKYFISNGHGNIWLTFSDDKPIAAALILHSGSGMFDKMGVSDQRHLDFRPNNLLLWEIIKHGQSQGFEYLDMGLSPAANTGLIRFKDSLGGIKTSINYYRRDPENYDIQQEEQIKKLLSSMTTLFVNSDVPDKVVQQAGKLLYRYFG